MIPLIVVADNEDKWSTFVEVTIRDQNIQKQDVYTIKPLKIQLGIDSIRLVKKELITANKTARLFVLYSFDNATLEAQNALLKTLEENSESNQFLLLVTNFERVLPTIRSRSKRVDLQERATVLSVRKEAEQMLKSLETATGMVFLSDPILAKIDREHAILLIDDVILYYSAEIRISLPSSVASLRLAFEYKRLMNNNNLNPQLGIDSLLIGIHKLHKKI